MKKKKATFVLLVIIVALVTSCTIHAQLTADKKNEPTKSEVTKSAITEAPQKPGANGDNAQTETAITAVTGAAFDITSLYGVPFEADIGGGLTQVILLMDAENIYFYNYQGDEQTAAFAQKYIYKPINSEIKLPSETIKVSLSEQKIMLGNIEYIRSNRIITGDFYGVIK